SLDTCHGPDARSTASGEWKPPKACSVRDCHAVPRLRSRGGSAASAVAPGVGSVAAGGRLRVRSASRPLHSQSLSPVGTLSDSWSPSLQGDKVSLQLRGDIILEHLHTVNTFIDTGPERAYFQVFRCALLTRRQQALVWADPAQSCPAESGCPAAATTSLEIPICPNRMCNASRLYLICFIISRASILSNNSFGVT